MALLLLMLGLSCAPHTDRPLAPETQPVKITLDPDSISYDEQEKLARFTPNSHVQSASYTTYLLDLASLEAVLGGRPTEPVDVLIEVGPEQVRTVTPDPMMPSPMGGFRIVERQGRVLSLAP